ncbi:endothelin-converting enzyme homolog [Osmia lignaria lignaria]|uniref:endothelin-converting enzyme homolog n=1 Tax=Osmia lignaria lignaria TaxID=1437193 RepID=UPI00402B2B61
MPSQRSYQVTAIENNKVAEYDQSYRSCLLALIIFFFLCIILILVSLPWKKSYVNQPEYKGEQVGTAQHHHHDHEHHTERTTTTTKSNYYPNTVVTLFEPKETIPESETSTEDYNIVDPTNESGNSSKFGKLLNDVDTTEGASISPVNEDDLYGNPSTINPSTENVSSITLFEPIETIPEFKTSTEDYNIVDFTNESGNSSKFGKLLSEVDTTEVASISPVNEDDLYDNRSTINTSTEDVSSITEQEINTTQSSNYSVSNSTNLHFITEDTFSEVYQSTTNNITEITTENHQDTLNHPTILSTMMDDTTSEPLITSTVNSINEKICTTGECKNIASKMLFYMNHTTDPCEDFYEYACGGFESNPQTVDQNLEHVAYERILRQMQKELRQGKSSLFAKYYNSCLQYENIELTERIKLARQALDKVGKFYTTEDWTKNHTSFTELLAKLLLQNSALLFDLSPDLDEYSPKHFTLKIGPTTYKNPFEIEESDDPCYASEFEREQETVDLGKLYNEYKACKNDTEKFIKSISKALTALGVFSELNSTYNILQNVQTTVIKIDLEIVQKFFANYPSKEKIREAYLMKNYTRVDIETLDKNYKVVNWTQLIYLLTKRQIKPEARVQVYFYDALAQGLKSLEKFKNEDPMQLNNALLGLYARNLYHELVLPKQREAKEYCLRVAVNVLIPEASDLYVSSFSRDQLVYINKTIHRLFDQLKETLKLNVKEVEWAAPNERNALIAKIDDLKIAVPDISYLTNNTSTYRITKANEIDLSDNYVENSVTLMQRYRRLIYAELFKNPGDPEQTWTHYATPFQSKGLAIYGLNLVVIPFGVIDWSTKYDELSFDYIILATLGNVIAHQIAHHFDANGIYYWNGTRDTENSLLSDKEDYINNERNILYQNPMNMTISSSGQTVAYEILQLSLNERLSEAMGLRLAYDTLGRLRSPEEVHLPWLKLKFDQLFYLTYAQMHCTKSPLTSSYISLYENEQLPSRIRIFVSASNNKLLGKAWDCPEGSQIMPSYTCTPFPYLQCN